MDERKRTFDTPVRSAWNRSIHYILKAIDNHTALHLATGLAWHAQKAVELRQYLHELKSFIHEEEGRK